MTRIGITGHQQLTAATQAFVIDQLRELLSRHDMVIGVTSLAVGADQLFAQVVLALGGAIEVIVPSKTYRDSFKTSEALAAYDNLLAQATHTIVLPFKYSLELAFMAASQEVVRRSDMLIAVWDGQPAHGFGGTADVVEYARICGTPVVIVWPPGATRS